MPLPEKSPTAAMAGRGPGSVRAPSVQVGELAAGRVARTRLPDSAPVRVAASTAGRPASETIHGARGANTAPSPAGRAAVATGTGFGSVLTARGWRSRRVRVVAAGRRRGRGCGR